MRRLVLALCCATLAALPLVTPPPSARAAMHGQQPAAEADYASVHIAFTGTDGNVYLVDGTGAHRTQVTAHAGKSTSYPWYAWSPDHRYLLVERSNSTSSSYTTDILVLNRDGSLRSTVVTRAPGFSSFYANWALDGDVIAYDAATKPPSAAGSDATVTVNRVDVAGTKMPLWTFHEGIGCGGGGPPSAAANLYNAELPGFVTHSLQWTIANHFAVYPSDPCDGTGVAVTDFKTGKTQTFPAAITGLVLAPMAPMYAVTSSSGITVYRNNKKVVSVVGGLPAWSPDSHYLYFQRYRQGPMAAIFKLDVAHADVTQMIPWQQKVYSFGPLHVTPNGRALIMSRIDSIDAQHARIGIQRLDAGGLTTLATNASRPAL